MEHAACTEVCLADLRASRQRNSTSWTAQSALSSGQISSNSFRLATLVAQRNMGNYVQKGKSCHRALFSAAPRWHSLASTGEGGMNVFSTSNSFLLLWKLRGAGLSEHCYRCGTAKLQKPVTPGWPKHRSSIRSRQRLQMQCEVFLKILSPMCGLQRAFFSCAEH